MMLSAGFFASASVRDNYDIVGFDPAAWTDRTASSA